MTKRFGVLLLNFIAGMAGNLFAAWVQQDIWHHFFTPVRLIATAITVLVSLVLIAALDKGGKNGLNHIWAFIIATIAVILGMGILSLFALIK